ncbi:MAG TPA: LUD domain-containing protein [Anaeromyxobacter sp.]|nr:LUD domain-containing protein [Anaeromyxobacter sp.]
MGSGSGSRRAVLDALRAARAPESPPPDLSRLGARFPDPAAKLAEAVAAVAGTLVRVPDAAALAHAVAALAAKVGATRVCSAVPGVRGNVALDGLADPHDLEGIGLAVLAGAFAVAENGAVWLPTAGLRHRGVFVVAEHLALAVPASEVVSDMHEAYRRISFPGAGFGTFIAGPSKTADIEQALVIGAHGARSCTVFLVG